MTGGLIEIPTNSEFITCRKPFLKFQKKNFIERESLLVEKLNQIIILSSSRVILDVPTYQLIYIFLLFAKRVVNYTLQSINNSVAILNCWKTWTHLSSESLCVYKLLFQFINFELVAAHAFRALWPAMCLHNNSDFELIWIPDIFSKKLTNCTRVH